MNIPRLSQLAETLTHYRGPFDMKEWPTCAISLCPDLMGKSAKKPKWQGTDWWWAVKNYFDIYPGDAKRLFSPLHYPASEHKDPGAVAMRILELIS